MYKHYRFIYILLFASLVSGCKKDDETTDNQIPVSADSLTKSIVLYGMTEGSGSSSALGTIYRINGDGSGFTILMNFDSVTPKKPGGALCEAGDHNFYGICEEGSLNGGWLFRYVPDSNLFSTYVDAAATGSFTSDDQGGLWAGGKSIAWNIDFILNAVIPAGLSLQHGIHMSEFTKGDGGVMVATTDSGGSSGGGCIIGINTTTHQADVYKSFAPNDAITGNADRHSRMCLAADHLLYGLNKTGGINNKGVFYRFDPATYVMEPLVAFNGNLGAYPQNGCIQGSDGLIYGMTSAGGLYNKGVLFSYKINTQAYRVVHHFNGMDGDTPVGSLLQDKYGFMYGCTRDGGSTAGGAGVVFRFNPVNNDFKVLHTFIENDADGWIPAGGLLIRH